MSTGEQGLIRGSLDALASPVNVPAASVVDLTPLLTNAQPFITENRDFIMVQLEVVGAAGGAAGQIKVSFGKSLRTPAVYLDDTQAEDATIDIDLNGTTTERKSFLLDTRGSPAFIFLSAENTDAAVDATLQIRLWADVTQRQY